MIASGPARQGRVGHVTVGGVLVHGGMIGPRVVRWYKASRLPGSGRNTKSPSSLKDRKNKGSCASLSSSKNT